MSLRARLSAASLLVALAATGLPLTPGATAVVPVPDRPAASVSAKPAAPKPLRVFTTSNRPDLISGGDARVAVEVVRELRRTTLRMTLNGRDVTGRFALRSRGRYEAYLTGLRVGRNVVTATAQGYAGRLVITNHPAGGPLFSGPQTQHYRCQAGARDAQCNRPATYRYLYRSTDPLQPGLQPYDPQHPPADVATTTTDRGVEVPFVVRREDGFQDRDRYTILTLWQVGKPWSRFAPQPQYNHKVLVTHGGGCGASYTPGQPPLDDYSGTIPSGTPGLTPSYVTALGRGFTVLSTALDNTGHNCSVAMNAESVLMAKERVVEQYGSIRYTIGTGCSGGSIAQHTVANAYPGIYQGLVTTCSYPDTFSAGAQFADYHLLRLYFEDPSRWASGVLWSPTQFAAVEGHLTHVNAVVADEGLFKAALDPEHACPGTLDPVAGDVTTRYDSETNPSGVRCSVLDLLVNQLGPRPPSVWTPQEKAAGHGFGGVPFANTGVVYGLGALRDGLITTAQFVDLNVKVGGLDVDSQPTAGRIAGDPASVAHAYRTGLVNEATNLDQVAIINHGGPDPGIAHDYAHAFWTEDRLMRAQGHTDNRVMWFGVTPLIGDPRWATDALLQMDRWLHAVERDHSAAPLARKITAARKRLAITDRCANVPGVLQTTDADGEVTCVLPDAAQLRLSTPREVAGGDRYNDVLSCRLTPLTRAAVDVGLVPLSDAEYATLQGVFPDGVCDYSQRGLGQQGAQTWLTYSSPTGGVVYGGRNLPPVAPRQADAVLARSFRSQLRQ
ncbi:DUF6351 family protein [Nocardioides rubriscoriae]|uniref:DUF6351 family protein n=1 Tax=Nocardioides rubriscoriae TaxID=642762 RepID=UPI001B86225C|nr:DUF6351 family protein [Nocardioides rubriscoriae]